MDRSIWPLLRRWEKLSQQDCAPCRWGFLAALAVYYFIFVFRFGALPGIDLYADAKIIFESSREIARSGSASGIFPYPPPAALLFSALTALGPAVFMVGWLIAMAVALYGSISLSLRNFDNRQIRWQVAFSATLFFADGPVEYDLGSRNNNLMLLALVAVAMVAARRRSYLSAVLVALATTFKLYSGILFLWFAVFRPKAALVGLGVLIALWIALPVAIFGPQGAFDAFVAWYRQLGVLNGAAILDDIRQSRTLAPVISLRLIENDAVVHAILFGWSALLAVAFWLHVRHRSMWSAREVWPLLLLAPLPFSPWLEKYHLVAVIPAYAFVCWNIVERKLPNSALMLVAGLLALAQIQRVVPMPFVWRGAGFVWEAAFLVIGLVATAMVAARQPDESLMPAADPG